MSAPNEISPDKLNRLIGTPGCPCVIDVRTDEAFAADPRILPASLRRDATQVQEWGAQLEREAVVVCQRGGKLSHGTAAWLRQMGVDAVSLEGGFAAWDAAGNALVPTSRIPPRDSLGRTVWVTRARPKIDRIACPWLIRRFVDPFAVFLYVPPSEVVDVGEKFNATPFDIENTFWSHRGGRCTFDTMVEEFALSTEALLRLADIVRCADVALLDDNPQAPGLLAASLGLSRMYSDDLEQLEHGLDLYDAFYRWCRDATDETHNWPTNRPAR